MVPSIWLENSPLVIHEAQQAGVLVITADVGGMAEYVHHEARTECVPKDTEGEVLVLNVAMGCNGKFWVELQQTSLSHT